jgi:hypothetical protein
VNKTALALLAAVCLSATLTDQQVAAEKFDPVAAKPIYTSGNGPLVFIDEAHTNFHTLSGRFQAFAKLLRKDGFVVEANTKPFSQESLRQTSILVISNALHPSNEKNWSLPTPSAFTPEEIAELKQWIEHGGALWLIADHMPLAGAATELGKALGVEWSNGFAIEGDNGGPMFFRTSDQSLRDHPILHGRDKSEEVTDVATFTGSAFRGADLQPLFVFRKDTVSLEPEVAWQFTDSTKKVPVAGWYQGATRRLGRGRIAVFGEAAMFTAQLAGPNQRPVGMNSPDAKQNPQFLLNVAHWLMGYLETTPASPLVGDWKGTSICKANRGVCKDENVVWRIKADGAPNTFTIDGDKIVNGEREFMGTTYCKFDPAKSTLNCTYRDRDHWDYKVTGDSMKGTLVVPNGTLYRAIELKKVKKDWRTE